MYSNESMDLFEDLKELGLESATNVPIYQEKQNDTYQKEKRSTSPQDYLFDRKVICPVCHTNVNMRSVKSSSCRIEGRDTDFMVYYSDPNPTFYDAWVCDQCGYAAMSTSFKNISEKQIKVIREKIGSSWKPKTYADYFTIDIAIERYKLALLNTILKNSKSSERAAICLKLGWFYRIKKDLTNEKRFLYQALQGFLRAYEEESFPIAGMDAPSTMYLMGELYRRLDDSSNALLWFGRVLSDRTAKSKIIDMVRDQRYLMNQEKIKNQRPVLSV